MMKKHNTESLKQQITQGTMHLIASGGISNFSFPKLAASTGIVAPKVYEHYKNKDDLLASCFLKIDAEIGRLLADAMKTTPPHRECVKDVENYCWLLWITYWRYLMADTDRTLFYWAFYNSEYYTEAVALQRGKNYVSFVRYVNDIDISFHVSARCNRHVLIMNLIDGTLNAAVKVLRGEFENDDVTINTIYQTVFQPVFAVLELGV